MWHWPQKNERRLNKKGLCNNKKLNNQAFIYSKGDLFMQGKDSKDYEADIMSLDGFSKVMQIELSHKLRKEGYQVELVKVPKNNGVIFQGIAIKGNSICCPIIYMEGFYDIYADVGNDDILDDLVARILKIFYQNRNSEFKEIKDFGQWEAIKDSICCKLINYERNLSLLEDVPYFKLYDLAIIFCVRFTNEEIGTGSVQIYNRHLDMWGIDKYTLLAETEKNMSKLLPLKKISTNQFIANLGTGSEKMPDADNLMFTVTTDSLIGGAINAFHPGYLQEMSEELNDDIIILPSSINEGLWVPLKAGSIDYLLQMVREINHSPLLSEEEFLSDNIYIYSREKKQITVIK